MSLNEWASPNVQVNVGVHKKQLPSDDTASEFDCSVDAAQAKYQCDRRLHWNEVARKLESWRGWGGYYHRRLIQVYRSLVAPGQSVIELGCAHGDLLAAVKPALGVGVDFSEEI